MLQRITRAVSAAATILALTACAAGRFDLPAVSADTDGQRRPGKFIWQDLISDDPAGSQRFYSELYGWEFRPLGVGGGSYWLISQQGVPIGGMVDQRRLPATRDISQWVSVLSSADIDASAAAVRAAGGAVLREPVALGKRGRIAVFTDPQGALFAALETPGGDPRDASALPPVGGFLWHELWTSDPGPAARFYAGLSDLDARQAPSASAGVEVAYYVLSADERPRAGVRTRPAEDAPPLWVPYLRVDTRARLEALLARVPGLGGEVLVPMTTRPAGGHVALVAGPSGAPIALQTWADGVTMSTAASPTGVMP
jgi:predicted enzyme related to lactoylglutathione lyase